jgi:type IV fimbrial biogenesis protein FimT
MEHSSNTVFVQWPAARGFTLVELMVVVAITAIIAAFALPSFVSILERYRVRQAAEALQGALYYARSEAIKRGGGVLLAKLPNNTGKCTTAGSDDHWDCGWQVCAGSCDTAADPPGTILQRYDAPGNLDIVRGTANTTIALDRWGLPSAQDSFTLYPHGKSGTDAAALGVCMGRGGRARVAPSDPCS